MARRGGGVGGRARHGGDARVRGDATNVRALSRIVVRTRRRGASPPTRRRRAKTRGVSRVGRSFARDSISRARGYARRASRRASHLGGVARRDDGILFSRRATRATVRSRVAIRGGVVAIVATTRLRRDSRATTGTNRAKFQRVGVLSALATRVHARRASRVGGGGSPSTRVGDASTTTRRASRVGVVARRRSRRARRRVGTLGVSRRVARDSRVVGDGGSEWSRARETTNRRRVRARRRASTRDRLRRRRRRVARRLRRTRDAHARTTTTRIEEKKARDGRWERWWDGWWEGKSAEGDASGGGDASGSGFGSGSGSSGSVSSVVSVVIRIGETREETRTRRRSRRRVRARRSDHAEENGRTRRRVRVHAKTHGWGRRGRGSRVARGEVSGRVRGVRRSRRRKNVVRVTERDENSNVAGARVAPRPRADALARRVRR